MHVAIVGAGSVGRVYGARLALQRDVAVTLVVRPPLLGALPALRVERIDGDRAAETWDHPPLAAAVPPDADVVVVAVRAEQLDASLDALLDPASAPIVVLTPLMPDDASRLAARYGARLCPGMVGVVSYVNDAGVTRYWLPVGAATLLEDASPAPAAVADLVRALVRAGLKARLDRGVLASNLATTVAIAPAAMAIDAAGGIDALLADRALLALALAALKEGLVLSGRVGEGASWLGYFTPFLGKTTVRIGASLARARAPEAFRYVESHFGRKLHAQNVSMGRDLLALAARLGAPRDALEELLARLLPGAPPPSR